MKKVTRAQSSHLLDPTGLDPTGLDPTGLDPVVYLMALGLPEPGKIWKL